MVQYYLRHYFNPDFDYLNLKPGGDNGASDVYSLGYVQNVIAGQVLAELVPLDNAEAGYDRRFVLDKPVFPMPAPVARIITDIHSGLTKAHAAAPAACAGLALYRTGRDTLGLHTLARADEARHAVEWDFNPSDSRHSSSHAIKP